MAEGAVKRLHPSWIFLRAISTLQAMALPLAVFLLTGGSLAQVLSFAVAGGFIALAVAARAAAWWRFTYAVTPQGLRVRSGLIARRDRLIPFERIQAVDLNEGLLHRLFRVVQVKIESAAGGSGEAEVVLGAVSRAEATWLRTALLRREATTGSGSTSVAPGMPTAAATAELIRSVSFRELVIAGATSSRVGPALAFFGAGAQFADDLVPDHVWERAIGAAPEPTVRVIVVVVLLVTVAAWLLAIASTLLTFAGFELRREGDRLLIAYGLLERRRSSIPLARIQAVTVSEGWLRQPFGLASARVESAGWGKDTATTGVLVPIIRLADLPALLEQACPAYAAPLDQLSFNRLPHRARRRYAMAGAWSVLTGAALATAVTSALPWIAWWWGGLILALLPAAVGLELLRHRDAGWTVDATGLLVARMRRLDRVTMITRRQRLQERSVRQHPLQRRASLATFQAAVASGGSGGRLTLKHLDAGVAFELLDRLGPSPHGAVSQAALALTIAATDDDD